MIWPAFFTVVVAVLVANAGGIVCLWVLRGVARHRQARMQDV